ncbi:MAG TPA: hypothetical protein VMZ22_11765 [Acidimicrobiales bacterium]|nr:hypothetical protein [Acidimicrobiales bacterium]
MNLLELPPPSKHAAPLEKPRRDPFAHAPRWVRDVLAVAAGVLAVAGAFGAFVVDADSDETQAAKTREVRGELADVADTVKQPAKFQADDSKFRADFPGEPERSTEKVDVAPLSFTMTTYTVERSDSAYLVMTSPFAAEVPFDFDGAATGAAQNIDGRLVSKQRLTFHGHPAMELVLSFDGGRVRALVVRAPDRVVQLMVISDADATKPYELFRDSLEIL